MNKFYDLKQLEENLHEIIEKPVMIIPVDDGYQVVSIGG